MSSIESIVRKHLCKSLKRSPEEEAALNLDDDLVYEYGLASLDRIVLMTSVCGEANVSLAEFGEDDIAQLRTPRGIIELLASKQPERA
jgi:acyl carrier protein